jgi:hypothetical protein
MAFWAARQSRPFVALAMVSVGLAACNSATPTALSSLSASGAAPRSCGTRLGATRAIPLSWIA